VVSNESNDSSGIFSGEESFSGSSTSLNSSRASLTTPNASPILDESSFIGRSYEQLLTSCFKKKPSSNEDRLVRVIYIFAKNCICTYMSYYSKYWFYEIIYT